MTIKRILVPIDFSAPSLRGLDYAIGVVKDLDAALDVLFVVETPPFAVFADLDGRSVNFQRLLLTLREAGAKRLAALAARLAPRVRLHTAVEVGQPHAVIVEQAARRRADLIIMATRGRTGLSHMLLGSVTERVVRTAPCPVLTVRRRDAVKRRRKGRPVRLGTGWHAE